MEIGGRLTFVPDSVLVRDELRKVKDFMIQDVPEEPIIFGFFEEKK